MKYRGRIVDNPSSAPSDATLKRVEDLLGEKLPDDYWTFLRSCNGGYVDYEYVVQFEDGTSQPLSFSGFHRLVMDGEWETNPFELLNARRSEGYPPVGVLPIARDGGGGHLYLDLRNGYRVVAFVQGLPAWTGLRQKDSLIQLAGSFDEYWDKLTITDSYVQDFLENYDPKYGDPDAAAEWLDTGSPRWRDKFSQLWHDRVLSAHGNPKG